MSRFMISAAHKSSGKTVVSTGLARALTRAGDRVQCFKKGPDYIDPMWLARASGRPCYNLDFNTQARDEIGAFFAARAAGMLTLVEANKGLFDGLSTDGSDSNAALAALLDLPVVLVVDAQGTTRGIAPLLQGYAGFDPDVTIAGVILNKVAGPRHEAKLRAAVEAYTDLPVLGALPNDPSLEIGERHLGLTTPAETGEVARIIDRFADAVAAGVDLDALRRLAATAPPLPAPDPSDTPPAGPRVRIAIAQDTAFGFYYPDDLQAFAAAGAELVPFDALHDPALPAGIDGLFIGGGFPETQMEALSANAGLRADIRARLQAGLPAYAECGGLMYLCRSLGWKGRSLPMVGAVPGDAVMNDRPQGRGYARFVNTEAHPWQRPGAKVRAHEFHYAHVTGLPADTVYARRITRGAGVTGDADAIVIGNLVAGFCHLRQTRANPWVADFVAFVRRKARKAA